MQRCVATSVLEEIRKNERTFTVRSFFFFGNEQATKRRLLNKRNKGYQKIFQILVSKNTFLSVI